MFQSPNLDIFGGATPDSIRKWPGWLGSRTFGANSWPSVATKDVLATPQSVPWRVQVVGFGQLRPLGRCPMACPALRQERPAHSRSGREPSCEQSRLQAPPRPFAGTSGAREALHERQTAGCCAAIKGAVAAGVEVARVEVNKEGRIVIIAGKPNEVSTTPADALDSWMARNARSA
jgi:hypothetical protein